MRIVLATHNVHKVGEFQTILGAHISGLDIVADDGPEAIEDGTTFAENALIKARAAHERTGLPALADDSGICVDVLGGAPGIFSARWAGRHGDDRGNLDLLLAQLSDVTESARRAHFSCAIALVAGDNLAGGDPTGDTQMKGTLVRGAENGTYSVIERTVEGQWHGRIARERRGEHGFGYDPIFLPDGLDGGEAGLSAAELAPGRKNTLSHRARALALVAPFLAEIAAG